MAISVQCGRCGKTHVVPDDWVGRIARCNDCGAENQIPGSGMTPVEPMSLELMELDAAPQPPAPTAPPRIAPRPALPPFPPPMPAVAQAAPGGPAPAVVDVQAVADAESSRRTGHLVVLGVLLCLAFILPEVRDLTARTGIKREGGDHHLLLDFPNLRGLWVGQMPLWTRIESFYPLIAGVVVIVLGAAWEHRGRGAALLFLATLPFILDAALPGTHGAIRSVASFLVLAPAVFVCVLRARFYRPRWGLLYWAGLAAAGLFVAALLVPCKTIDPSGGRSVFRYVTAPFSSGSFSVVPVEMKIAAIGGLIMHVLFGLAIILTLCNVPKKSGGAAASMAALSGTFAVLGAISLLLLAEFVDFDRLDEQGGTVEFLNRPKAVLLYGGYLLVAIAGVVDVIIGAARAYHVGRAGQ
jgi:hypothetical protein